MMSLQDLGVAPGWPTEPADKVPQQMLTQGCK